MSSVLPKSIRKLIEELSKLPGIGPKSAQRLAFFLLRGKNLDRQRLSDAIKNLTQNLAFCRQCHNLSEGQICQICADKNRDQNMICVVEEPLDVVSLEQGHSFKGTYHVLGGAISPMDGIGPEDLKIGELVERIQNLSPPSFPPAGRAGNSSPPVGEERTGGTEVIIATNPSLEGESTALYLAKQLKQFPKLKITRIAHGLPIGGDIEYADELTIRKALEGRRDYYPMPSPPPAPSAGKREGEIERGS